VEFGLLGQAGFTVSRLCFGTLTLGPLQARLPVSRGADLIRQAVLEHGVNFFDGAELYDTYEHLCHGLRGLEDKTIVASKSYACDAAGMERSLEKALRHLGRDRVEIFCLHEQESELTLEGHRPALEYLLRAKERGLVGALGVSTHHVAGVRAAAALPEVDVIHPIINRRGLGIRDGSLAEMLKAVEEARRLGKGVYSMKALGGGNLIGEAEEAIAFVRDLTFVDSIALGIKTPEELAANVALVLGESVPAKILAKLKQQGKALHIESWCTGCGSCLRVCHQQALTMAGGRAAVRQEACVLCGYCGAECPEFAIKVI
jgi:aryl-alcohol dehydrogenase-like predicted oxidoreductase